MQEQPAGEPKLAAGRLFIFFIIIVAIAGGAFYKWGLPKIKARQKAADERQKAEEYDKASAGGKYDISVTCAGDAWSGYSLFRSAKFRSFLSSLKIGYRYETEENLQKRFAALADGKYDFAVATIDGYTLNALESNYPGVIIFLVDESDGGDSIIGGPNARTIDDLEGHRVAYTANSPSEHLLDVTLTHFDIFAVERAPVTAGSSGKCYEMLQNGRVDAAVVWEPETSQAAVDPTFEILTSTKDSDDIIIDVCIASRRIITGNHKVVQDFVRAYFKTLSFYLRNDFEFNQYLAEDGGVSAQVAGKIYDGIDFTDLGENNYLWFGIGADSEKKIGKIIDETVAIQIDNDKLVVDPFRDKPGGADWIVNDEFLNAMSSEATPTASKFKKPRKVAAKPVVEKREFKELKENEWETKTERVGELQVDPIYFATGSSEVTRQSKVIIDRFATTFAHYPNYRMELHGYSSPTGSSQANMRLSQERAASIGEYLAARHAVQRSRLRIIPHGDAEPLSRKPGESDRDWWERNQRTEFVLVKERM